MPGLTDFSSDIRAKIIEGEPVPWHGLLLYPVMMRDYEMFTATRISLSARQSNFPMPYAVMPYLSALFALSADGVALEGYGVDLFQRFILPSQRKSLLKNSPCGVKKILLFLMI